MRILFIFLVPLALALSCKKNEGCMDQKAPNYDNDAKVNCCCDPYGQVSFWSTSSLHMHVIMNGRRADRQCTHKGNCVTASPPACDNQDGQVAAFILSPGTYNYEAFDTSQDTIGLYQSGTVVVTDKSCQLIKVQ